MRRFSVANFSDEQSGSNCSLGQKRQWAKTHKMLKYIPHGGLYHLYGVI